MKQTRPEIFNMAMIALVTLVHSSCVPSTSTGLRKRDVTDSLSGSSVVNEGQGRVLADNPIILSKNKALSDSYDLNRLLSTVSITNDAFLTDDTNCSDRDFCLYYEVRENKDSPSALQTANGKWGYNAYTNEFLQVNTYYHLKQILDSFYSNLNTSYSLAYDPITSDMSYDTALPRSLLTNGRDINSKIETLIAYANCNEPNNAYFDRATLTLCLGYIDGHSKVKWAQDSTVIYHEAAHYLHKLQLNFRNHSDPVQADLGNGIYDEAGAIGEGLADYYSYYINGRTHFAEWGAGRFLNADRPMTESDPLHVAGLSSDPDQRLSYPQYVGYDPYNPTTPVAEIHYTGMIISHYLVALTEDLMTSCKLNKRDASNTVMHLITETLAELGDLTTQGTESNFPIQAKINMNTTRALDWFRKVNPVNFRSFMQTMAKNLLINLGNPALNRCNGTTYSADQIESLIDQYGLLLFRTYNENRSLSVPGSVKNTPVNALNRKKSVLVSKNLVTFDPTANASTAYVIDNAKQINDSITALKRDGIIGSLSGKASDVVYNNNNGKVSPGEIVAIILNLYNNSNSTIAGLQVLANDWNHADATGKPCRFDSTMSNDQWPLTSEGGVECTSVKAEDDADFAPVCFMQLNKPNATEWVSQKTFKTELALDNSFCLDPNNDRDCFVRAIKGADHAYFSKLNPKSTWAKTMTPASGATPKYDLGNSIMFEVSKHIPPGTTIDCRLRLRFTNCDDCFYDSTKKSEAAGDLGPYDYEDKDYNGPRPYKVIHLQIPITD